MEWPSFNNLALFMACVLVVFMFIVAVSGHFPAEHRKPALAGVAGMAILAGSSLVVAAAAAVGIYFAWATVPWYAAVIGGGLMILIAPYLLHPLPDRMVDGRGVLVVLAALSALVAYLMTVI